MQLIPFEYVEDRFATFCHTDVHILQVFKYGGGGVSATTPVFAWFPMKTMKIQVFEENKDF